MNNNTKGNFYGILLGFNKYDDNAHFPTLEFAEKDAEDLYDVLTSPEYGNYPKENFTLLTGSVTTDRVQTALYTSLSKRKKTDTVLVYYSGHGFIAGEINDAFLITPEATSQHLLNNPQSGLQVKALQDWFLETGAGTVIFVIDCCHSGAVLLNPYKGKRDTFELPLVDQRNYKAEGRVAFVSSPRGINSRESVDYANGIFTHFLLAGLRGTAAEPYTGDVTMESLIAFVEASVPASQPAVHYGHSKRLVLTTPKATGAPGHSANTLQDSSLRLLNISRPEGIVDLHHPLDRHLPIIDDLLSNLAIQPTNLNVNQRILEAIRTTVHAEASFVVRVEREPEFRAYDKFSSFPVGNPKKRDAVIAEMSSFLLANQDDLLKSRFGVVRARTRVLGSNNAIIAIPLWTDFPREFLLLIGLKNHSPQHGQVIGSIVKSLYHSTGAFTRLDLARVENRILDGLKRHFGHVPSSVYDRRFAAFKSELSKIRFYFEPVVNLGKRNPQIDSWEALARDPETKRAPFSLFGAAELWGPNFLKALDIYCLKTATAEYLRLWNSERGNQKKDQLSVNVYPETLLSQEYEEEIGRIVVEADLLKPKELVLEVSERRSISKSHHETPQGDPVELLEKRMRDLARIYGIAFAIDDFGVGYSSIERLIRLELDHVKIDREVLRQRHPNITISYVLGLVQAMHLGQTNVVVEGFDGFASISLYELHKLGVLFVQGHQIRKASPNLAELSIETKDMLRMLTNTKPPRVSTRDEDED